MKVKLKKHWTVRRTISQKFNTAFLRDTDKLNKFQMVLSNKFQAFHDLLNGEETTLESNWKGIKEAITSTFHEVLGHKKAAINTSRTRAEKARSQQASEEEHQN
ncbi:unnamed protein product [Schistosoma curassoni]|uniref:Retrovirus-related Pol polyprotein from transposon TNT 1-94 n=1 Tax=Schistosoma curassoni TaxID=6186 RepID=A0A183KEN2_9TREM|nr:unnamed protein product [Schistosoma curassoni]